MRPRRLLNLRRRTEAAAAAIPGSPGPPLLLTIICGARRRNGCAGMAGAGVGCSVSVETVWLPQLGTVTECSLVTAADAISQQLASTVSQWLAASAASQRLAAGHGGTAGCFSTASTVHSCTWCPCCPAWRQHSPVAGRLGAGYVHGSAQRRDVLLDHP